MFTCVATIATAVACASITRGPSPAAGGVVNVQVLAINDFHGNLEPPSGASGRVDTVDAGGVEHLGAHIARLEATNPYTVVVSAGDNIGASPFLSGMFHDEPTIEALGAIGLDVSTVGNHEFDEGSTELIRMQRGGCHPTDGCQDGTPFAGAAFEFLSANVRVKTTGNPLFPASTIRTFDGVQVGFIGLALEGTPDIVVPSGVADLAFGDAAEAANAAAVDLRRRGVNAMVVLIHEGVRWPPTGPADCTNVSGAIVSIVQELTDDIAVVVSGHSHERYTCDIGGKLVTSAYSAGRLITDIDLVIDRATGRVVSKTAVNVPVTRDISDARATAIINRYRPFALEVRRTVGTIATTLTRVGNAAGETSLGGVVADAILAGTRDPAHGGAQIAFMNRGGMRTDLERRDGFPERSPAPVSYADVFSMLPFGNTVIVKTLTGETLVHCSSSNSTGSARAVTTSSRCRTGSATPTIPRACEETASNRASLAIDGRVVEREGRYRVAMSDFLWGGGEGFAAAAAGTDPVARGLDIDTFLDYLGKRSPLVPAPSGRIRIAR